MSTHLNRPDADLEPVSHDDLIAYFHDGSKPVEAWRVGAEFEKFALDRSTGKQIGFDGPRGIETILRALADRLCWEPHFEADRLTTLTRAGSTVSVEPGGQVELATPPSTSLAGIRDELTRHLAELRAVTDPARVAWVSAGLTPFSSIEEIPLNPRPRHRLMAEYLPTRCEFGLHMMKGTASTQVAFDYLNEADAGRKLRVAVRLGPAVNALFANAPLHVGTPTGFASFRGHVWHGMDDDRSGLLVDLLRGAWSFDRYAAFALDVPMLFVADGDALLPPPGMTFREFLLCGFDGRFPNLHDWELHLSTIFTEVRLKHFLEVRGADATPAPLALAVPALWKGLLYDSEALTAAESLAERFDPGELCAFSERVAAHGLEAEYRGESLVGWCQRILEVADAGLKRQGEDASFLTPLWKLLESGRSPSARWPKPCELAAVITAIEC